MEAALQTLVRAEPGGEPRLTVGGRTDAGVHARGQVAHLDLPDDLAPVVTARRLNAVLNQRFNEWQRSTYIETASARAGMRDAADVTVHAVREVPPEFDARFGALRRRYEYRVRSVGTLHDPLLARFTANVPRELNLDAMQHASDQLLGLQDFTTFCKAREGATAVRELLRFDWRLTEDGALAATIEADAFCHSMVRALVGGVVAVGSTRITEPELLALRDGRERTSRFTVMPAHGLSLEEIVYPPESELAARSLQTRAKRDQLDD
ncbi:MAG: tRNA pseudouridine(38-40) synthase TruA [Leucobacter sp.]|nr:tRNA pseudouridine(38-40) synthase TruA [Leucobacter sp.]